MDCFKCKFSLLYDPLFCEVCDRPFCLFCLEDADYTICKTCHQKQKEDVYIPKIKCQERGCSSYFEETSCCCCEPIIKCEKHSSRCGKCNVQICDRWCGTERLKRCPKHRKKCGKCNKSFDIDSPLIICHVCKVGYCNDCPVGIIDICGYKMCSSHYYYNKRLSFLGENANLLMCRDKCLYRMEHATICLENVNIRNIFKPRRDKDYKYDDLVKGCEEHVKCCDMCNYPYLLGKGKKLKIVPNIGLCIVCFEFVLFILLLIAKKEGIWKYIPKDIFKDILLNIIRSKKEQFKHTYNKGYILD